MGIEDSDIMTHKGLLRKLFPSFQTKLDSNQRLKLQTLGRGLNVAKKHKLGVLAWLVARLLRM